jgi:hypothetical protein
MPEKKEKQKPITTPAGIARYPWLTKPDAKFAKEGQKPKFKVDLILSGEAADKLKALITPLADAAKAENDKKNPKQKSFNTHYPFSAELDDQGEETGNTVFKFSANSYFEKDGERTDIRIPIFDAKRNKLESPKVGGGSEIKVAFTPVSFSNPAQKAAGVSLRLQAVQVLKLVEYTAGGNAENYGFGEEEGFSADEMPTEETPTEESGSDPSADKF